MTKNPTIVPPSTTLSTIQSIFNKNNFWSVYVGDSDRFLGIITRKDLHIRGKGFGPSSKAETIMSKNVLTIDENSDVHEAIRIIKQKKINGLGVTKKGKPCGIVTKADIKKKYHQKAFDNYNHSEVKRNKMTLCDFCGEKIKEILPWRCNYCGGIYCSDHRLPEDHNCRGLKGYSPISSKESIKNLLPFLKSEKAEERKKVAILLDGRNWIPPTDQDKAAYYFARQDWDSLITFRTPAFELLIDGLKDKDIKIRIACARSLGILGNPEAITPLLQIMYQNGTPHLLRNAITIALGNLGWSPKTDSEKISFFIAQQQWNDLIQFKEKIIGPLSALLDDNDEEIRFKATELLCELRDNRTIGILKNALKDKSKKVRITAVQGLVNLKNPDTIDTLIIALNDVDSAIQRTARNGLIRLDSDAVEKLIDTLKKNETDYPNISQNVEDIILKTDIIFILGEIQDSRALDYLNHISIEGKSEPLKKSANEAIGKIELQLNTLGNIGIMYDNKKNYPVWVWKKQPEERRLWSPPNSKRTFRDLYPELIDRILS